MIAVLGRKEEKLSEGAIMMTSQNMLTYFKKLTHHGSNMTGQLVLCLDFTFKLSVGGQCVRFGAQGFEVFGRAPVSYSPRCAGWGLGIVGICQKNMNASSSRNLPPRH